MVDKEFIPFLVAFRKIIEGSGNVEEKFSAVNLLSEHSPQWADFSRRCARTHPNLATRWFGQEWERALKGLPPKIAKELFHAGYRNREAVARSNDKELANVKGVGPVALRKIKDWLES